MSYTLFIKFFCCTRTFVPAFHPTRLISSFAVYNIFSCLLSLFFLPSDCNAFFTLLPTLWLVLKVAALPGTFFHPIEPRLYPITCMCALNTDIYIISHTVRYLSAE